MVHGNAVFIREEAKLARSTHRYTFSTRTLLLSTPSTSLSVKQTTPLWLQEIISSRGYDVMLGGFTHKSWHLRGAESFAFSQQLTRNLKSSTIKGPKSSS